mmetsp:Transcript_17434/g.39358  ORF Transcript_17434/g.39358 Transcript_17434/m.39358 type:complete len:90 (-) Transcript_17434:403-672(-)
MIDEPLVSLSASFQTHQNKPPTQKESLSFSFADSERKYRVLWEREMEQICCDNTYVCSKTKTQIFYHKVEEQCGEKANKVIVSLPPPHQ